MKSLLTIAVALAALFIIGCTPAEPAVTNEYTPATKETSSTNASTSAEMEKCEKCGMEVAKGELVSEDGKMVCDHCKKM